MDRLIFKQLQIWKNEPDRLPLLLRGARQVGKTHSIEQFAEKEFSKVVKINFEQQPEFIPFIQWK